MATQAQIDQVLNQINDSFENLFSFTIEELTREEALGTAFSFKIIESDFVKVFDLFKRVKEVDLKEVPLNLLNNLNQQLTTAYNTVKQAKDFNPAVSNAANVRQTIINNIQKQYDDFLTHSVPILTIGLLNSNDLSIERSKVNQLISDIETQKEASKEEAKKKQNELNSIIENAKSFATKAGVSKHSTLFKSEAEFHETEAKKWLKYTVYILIAIATIAVILAFVGLMFKQPNEIVQFTITKIVVLTALFYGLSITNRNYKAHKHNSIMNKHRQNALTTFETFSDAASADDQTKNAVLLETTHSIFANQQTGYLKGDGEGESNNKIIEIIKGVTNKGE